MIRCYFTVHIKIRDWSLITGRRGGGTLQNGSDVLPLQKKGGGGVLAMLKGGAHKVYTL